MSAAALSQKSANIETASASDSWATPPELFAALSVLYGPFDLDACAAFNNTKCVRFFDESHSSLERVWGDQQARFRVWCNPPYSRGNKPAFFAKARNEMAAGHCDVISLLVPHNTAEGWWTEHVDTHGAIIATKCIQSLLGKRTIVHTADLVIEVLALRGRVRFIETTGATYKQATAPFSSAVVTFSRPGALYPVELATRPRGRPAVITPEIVAKIQLLSKTIKVDAACADCGVSRSTWFRYQKRARQARQSTNGTQTDP